VPQILAANHLLTLVCIEQDCQDTTQLFHH